MNNFDFRAAFLLAALAAAPPAFAAQSQPAAMPVSATVPSSCSAFTGAPLAFGTLPASLAVTLANAGTTLTVNCANGAPYSIVAVGLYDNSGQHRMIHGTYYLLYNISGASAGGAAFPTGGTSFGGTGSSTNYPIPIYGQIPAQTAGSAGTYNDTLTFTLTY